MPLIFIDRPYRVWSVLDYLDWLFHTTLAVSSTKGLNSDVTINCVRYQGAILANTLAKVIGEFCKAFTHYWKETVLTGLYSRRKLFETLTYLGDEDSEKTSGVMMLDTISRNNDS